MNYYLAQSLTTHNNAESISMSFFAYEEAKGRQHVICLKGHSPTLDLDTPPLPHLQSEGSHLPTSQGVTFK
jgi:hypothetical protein